MEHQSFQAITWHSDSNPGWAYQAGCWLTRSAQVAFAGYASYLVAGLGGVVAALMLVPPSLYNGWSRLILAGLGFAGLVRFAGDDMPWAWFAGLLVMQPELVGALTEALKRSVARAIRAAG